MTPTPVALVVGGTSGIGLAAARRLATAGHDVHVAGRDPERAERAATTAPELTVHQVDARDRAAVTGLVTQLGHVDALVLTIASSAGMGPLAHLDLDALRTGFEEKCVAMLTVVQAALPYLAERASITLVGAISAQAAMPGTAGIGAVNAAVESLVRPLAVELAPRRVNAVSPGLVDTPWWDAMPQQARDEWFATAAAALPARHISSADEVGELVALLATNPSMTGTVVPIDAGARLVQI